MDTDRFQVTPVPESLQLNQQRNSVLYFLDRHYILLCVIFVVIAGARIVSSYEVLSLTADEPFHLACGIEYLSFHEITLDTENPPLAQAVGALLPYLDGAHPGGRPNPYLEGPLILSNTGHFPRTVFLFRLGTLPFFLLACFVVGWWAKHSFGQAAAAVSVALFSLLPTTLADASLGTTDMAVAGTTAGAFVATIAWAESPNLLRGAFAGFCTALAVLSKFTAFGYIALSAMLAALAYCLTSNKSPRELIAMAKRRLPTFGFALAVMLLVIWAAYWFSFGLVPRLRMSLPAPEFFAGIQELMGHNIRGHSAFLLGQHSRTGWWYYFPVALAVKTPIAFVILCAIGVGICFLHRKHIAYHLPMIFCAGVLLPAMAGRVDIGVRHVSAMYIALSIIAALGLLKLLQTTRRRFASGVVAVCLLVWMVSSVAQKHPDYVAYFNEFAGSHPENILDDSNYDWGQDLKMLAGRMRQLGATQLALGSLDGALDDRYRQEWYGLPRVTDVNDDYPTPGWTAISASFDKSYRFQLPNYHPQESPWYERTTPSERVGPYALYYTPATTQRAYDPGH